MVADAKGKADAGVQATSLISKSLPSMPLALPSSGGRDPSGNPRGNASNKPVTEGSASSEVVKATPRDSGIAVGGVEGGDFLVIPPKPGRPVNRPVRRGTSAMDSSRDGVDAPHPLNVVGDLAVFVICCSSGRSPSPVVAR